MSKIIEDGIREAVVFLNSTSEEDVMIKNAIIKSAEIFADNQHTHVTLILDYGDASQQVGPHELSTDLIRGIILSAGVREWSQIVGKPIRVKVENSGVVAMTHLLALPFDWVIF
jgi:hypothetical protein